MRTFSFVAALLLSLPALALADVQQPAPGTWALGWQGVGTNYYSAITEPGAPSIRYVATDKLDLELTPYFAYSHIGGPAGEEQNTQSFILDFAVIRRVARFGDLNVDLIAQPLVGYGYSWSTGLTGGRTKQTEAGLGAGLQLEYFLRPNLSLSAEALLQYTYAWGGSYTGFGSNSELSRSLSFTGQALNVHYYFTSPSPDEKPADLPGPGSWAIGWQGHGSLYLGGYSDFQPSLKYVVSDKTAIEAIPEVLVQDSDSGSIATRTESFLLPVDLIRNVTTRGPITLSYVIEPTVGYQVSKTAIPPVSSTRTNYWDFGLGGGYEIEYYVLPHLSLGARALLVYTYERQSQYAQTGYQGLAIAHGLTLGGRVLSVHWYFGGGS
jgi:hypothetical protein